MIYLDNNATTHMDKPVLDAMSEAFSLKIGNPSSPHSYGREAKHLFDSSLATIAAYFGIKEREILMTSGATEALNLFIQGFSKKGHIITSSLEHLAVLEPLQKLEKRGMSVAYLSPQNGLGAISAKQIEEAIESNTVLIVLSSVNNETGIKTPIGEIAEIAKRRGIFFLVDGVAELGKGPHSFCEGVSAICYSGHKMHAPAGVGCAIYRKDFPFDPLILGGAQQRGKRGGTENLSGVCGFAQALKLISREAMEKMEELRNLLEEGIVEVVPGAFIHGKDEKRVCNTTNICFPHCDGEGLLIQLDLHGVAASLGSACSAGGLAPSRVLVNMGVGVELARSSIRFSLSRFTTEKEIQRTIEIVRTLCG